MYAYTIGAYLSGFQTQNAKRGRSATQITNFRTQLQNVEGAAEGSAKSSPSHSERTFKTQSGDLLNSLSKTEG